MIMFGPGDLVASSLSCRSRWPCAESLRTTDMMAMDERKLLERITINAEIFSGKPIIRGRRLAGEQVLGTLAAGDSIETILERYPWLEREDIVASLPYARRPLADLLFGSRAFAIVVPSSASVIAGASRCSADNAGGRPHTRPLQSTVSG
jgi:uncharacterized protein (DUF433 family)